MEKNNLIGQQIQGYRITRKLGSGGFGTVYLGVKEDLGKQYKTAIKYISLPDPDGYDAAMQDYGYDRAAVHGYFEKMVQGITNEINTLLALSKKDNRYIVAYYDHDIQKSQDPLHYDIFMRMEYLTPLTRHIRRAGMTLGEVIKLGLNMCDALSLCHGSSVIHRDIKEANIFINEDGQYKLGDFGVAKDAIGATQSGSIKGTISYMAPELYRREPYNSSVDIYSLGIVLYKLLNSQRMPFMPSAPAEFTADDKELAETKRLRGETPPLPEKAQNRLGEIVVKACSAKSDRYATAEELKTDIQGFLQTLTAEEYGGIVIPPVAGGGEPQDFYDEDSLQSSTWKQVSLDNTISQPTEWVPAAQNPYGEQNWPENRQDAPQQNVPDGGQNKAPKKKRHPVLAAVIGVVVLAAGVAGWITFSRVTNPVNQFQKAIQDNDFAKASQLYQDKLKSDSKDNLAKATTFILDHAKEVKEQYLRSEIEYETALNQLQEMENIGIVKKEDISPLIEEINEIRTSRAAFENAKKEMESGNYKEAINDFHKVLQNDPNYTEAQDKLAQAVKGYKEDLIASLSGFEKDKKYKEAILALKEGLLVVPNDADLQAKITDYEKKMEDNVTLTVDELIRDTKSTASESEDYVVAIKKLRDAEKQYPKREEIKSAISEMEAAYVARELTKAEQLAKESKFEEAVSLLGEAQKQVPGDASLENAIKDYKGKYPVLLQQMVHFTGKDLENGGQEKDNLQNMQKNIVVLKDDHSSSYTFENVYKLKGEYQKITGSWYLPFEQRSYTSSYTSVLEIYGDEKLLFSAEMKAGVEPVSFDVDLTGVNDIKISVKSNYYAKLANVQLFKR